jgi:hypothetical protein
MADENVVPLVKIAKPKFTERFKSKRPPSFGGVETVLGPLPIMRISDANDFVRLHPSEDEYWTEDLCFTSVPIKGEKRDMLCVIDEALADQYLNAKKIKRQRLALATKPHDAMFFCIIPTQHTDNAWNKSTLEACEKAKQLWTQATSRKLEDGVEGYKITFATHQDAFPDPKWTTRTIDELLEVTFHEAMIEDENHPALRRLIGARQDLT